MRLTRILSAIVAVAFALTLFGCAGDGSKGDGPKGDGPKGIKNPQVVKEGLCFSYKPEKKPERNVFLTGGFNGWQPDDPKFELKEGKDGVWSVTVTLDPGKYEYKFVLDGRLVADPNAIESVADGSGGKKCLVIVK